MNLFNIIKGYFDQSVDIYKAPAVAQWILESAGREGQILLQQLEPIHKQCKVLFHSIRTSTSKFVENYFSIFKNEQN